MEEEKIRNLMNRFLQNQVHTYRAQMSPEYSLYDLYKVIYAKSSVMLKEHFRCVGPIIEYSKREFYNHEIKPLRLPKQSERIDPPLVDIIVQDGYRKDDVNSAEAQFIVEEICRITKNPAMEKRTIGVISLLGSYQAMLVWDMLTIQLGPDKMSHHKIACGDARTFQGKERDIVFLSLVVASNVPFAPLSRDMFAQRFNVAASRARDRMYLVRSVEIDNLSNADQLRKNLIHHFTTPFFQNEKQVKDLRELCKSPFEAEIYDVLTERGYCVTPQVKVGEFRIDMVVEGNNNHRLAIECDGDQYHGLDRWEADMQRQRILERAGWTFWRCFASSFIRQREAVINDLLTKLSKQGIEPVQSNDKPTYLHTEQRKVTMLGSDSCSYKLQSKINTVENLSVS